MSLNFSNIEVMLCCVGNDRASDVYAAAFNIMMNVSDTRVIIAYNTEELSEEAVMRKDLLEALSRATGNQFLWKCFPQTDSKAQMIAKVVQEYYNTRLVYSRNWYLNVDDDYMLPYKTLSLLSKASLIEDGKRYSTYVYGQFDIINYRNYEDWSAEKLELDDMFNFARENGLRCLPNHLMKDIPNDLITFSMPKQSTGAYMMRISRVTRESVLSVLQSWPKGKRGYDEFLCNAVGDVAWIYGSNSYHTDRTKAHVDGKVWTQDVFRDDLMMDGSVTGRLPSAMGEQSIKRGAKPHDAPSIPTHEATVTGRVSGLVENTSNTPKA